jgi:hypothetical protein
MMQHPSIASLEILQFFHPPKSAEALVQGNVMHAHRGTHRPNLWHCTTIQFLSILALLMTCIVKRKKFTKKSESCWYFD